MKIGRNDPCWCKSGLKYKHCHYEIDSASPTERVTAGRRVYDANWRKNAAHFASQGCYEWMASILKPFSPKRILDVGCGDGKGLLSLLTALGSEDMILLSLEENSECIRTTHKQLAIEGYDATIINRMRIEPTKGQRHNLLIETGKLIQHSGIVLIESDILIDSELESFLQTLPKFDAVTVWLIGTHLTRQECNNIAPLQIKSSGDYRLRVQNKIYELADKILRSGGVLQVVDRGEVPASEEIREDFLNAHREQAFTTSLNVDSLQYMIYKEVENARKIAVVTTAGTSGRIPEMKQLAMMSVVSIKL